MSTASRMFRRFSHRYNFSAAVIIMSSDVLLEEFEVGPIKSYRVVEMFSLGRPHLGPRVYLPNRTHKFVPTLIRFSTLG